MPRIGLGIKGEAALQSSVSPTLSPAHPEGPVHLHPTPTHHLHSRLGVLSLVLGLPATEQPVWDPMVWGGVGHSPQKVEKVLETSSSDPRGQKLNEL